MERESVADKIINIILDNIKRGEYKEGEKLPNEFILMSEMNVSRNSLREAMKALSYMGVIEIRRGHGTFICQGKNDKKDIWENVSYNEILEYRQNIDEMIARFAMGNITKNDILIIEENVKAIKIAISEEDFYKVRKLDFEFHKILINLSKNGIFIKNTLEIYENFFEFEKKLLSESNVNPMMTYFNKKLVVCIAKKDDLGIKKAVENCLSQWRERIL